MLKMFKNKKAQNTAEYAILIALVVGGVIAMQTYAQRALQGRIRDANRYFTQTTNFGVATDNLTYQYEPYYQQSSEQVAKDSERTINGSKEGGGMAASSNVTKTEGSQNTTYSGAGLVDGI